MFTKLVKQVAADAMDQYVEQLEQEVLEAKTELMSQVNAFFYERLMAVPSIRAYIEELQQ